MNESLMVIVEKIVCPINGPFLNKMRMRNELYTHLELIYEEEFSRCGDEQTAMEISSVRFGDLDQIRSELQSTIPRLQQFFSQADRMFSRRPDEPLFQHAARIAVVASLLYAVFFLVTMTAVGIAVAGRRETLLLIVPFFLCLTASFGMATFFAIACARPLVDDLRHHVPFWKFLLNSVIFGVVVSTIELGLLSFAPEPFFSVERLTTNGFDTGAPLTMSVAAFLAGTGIFLLVVTLMRRELGILKPWMALELSD